MITTLAVSAAVGTVSQANVSVPAPCAEQYTSASIHAARQAGSYVACTTALAVTPATETV